MISRLFVFLRFIRVRLIGRLNPIKTFQLKDIRISATQPVPGNLLDIGCGSGYLALEVARTADVVTGVDIKRNRHWRVINSASRKVTCATFDDFSETHSETIFDVILLSEVISEAGSPGDILDYYEKWLRRARKVVVVTSFGRPHIGKLINALYKNKTALDQYEQQLCKAFSVNSMRMHSREEIIQALESRGFVLSAERFPLTAASGLLFEAFQYCMVKVSVKPYGLHFLTLVPLMWITQFLGRNKSTNYSIMEFHADEAIDATEDRFTGVTQY